MPLYDLMLLLDPGVPSDRQESILRDVQGLIESGGKLVGNYDWGTRRMTFEIDHRPEAAYHLFQFEAEGGGALLERVDHSLKIMDGVLRHRIIRLKDGSPPPPTPAPDRRGGYGDYEADGHAEAPVAAAPSADAAETAAPGEAAATEAPAPAEAPAADAPAPAESPAGDEPVADEPVADAPAPAEEPVAPDAPASDDEAPSGPTAA
ncbi:MAG TPA: 30S ribosomal protein S6 [Thermoleophilaceae bacterium]|jgi:ribosomal protein S6|nr:30S ribosomal protein S6 [Thermoleophilaceae bacterium]